MPLSASKLSVVRTLVETAPDSAIRTLELALSAEGGHGPLSAVRAMVETEAADRQVRNTVMAPVVAMFGPSSSRIRFPAKALKLIWAGLKAVAPHDVRQAAMQSTRPDAELHPPPVLDTLCARAAEELAKREHPDFAAAAKLCDEGERGAGAAQLARCLTMAPMARKAMVRLHDWVERMTPERAVSVRLAYRDAADTAEDAGPLFFEMLAAPLGEPCLILRVISAVMERPSEAFLSTTELRSFGEDTLDSTDALIDQIRNFRFESGAAAGLSAAAAVHQAQTQIAEFESAVEVGRKGAWGGRLNRQREALAQAAERCLTGCEHAVATALPVDDSRLGGMASKGAPLLTRDPDPAAVARATAALAFCQGVRGGALNGGFATVRNRVIEAVGRRLDQHIEYLIALTRDDEDGQGERARRYLDVCADFMTYVRDEAAAQIVRRRMAAA